ncbi:aminoglycoside phosphotransferase family protein [Dactylosporangium sp. NPDC051484]|uniref:aminoglycoside phosphotransferase family protein n=1 Tax=Dactylosporangium sp. NPDC051484 TaxID=3154942 RepID=UPI00345011A7
MHEGEPPTDAELVRALVEAQFPQWAGLSVASVASTGTDNAIYRLGDALSVRLPRLPGATGQIELERRWLPRLAPHLPAEVPDPVAVGAPALGYPFAWAVYRWIDGANPGGPDGLAEPLTDFIAALRRIDTAGGPPARPGARGASLRGKDMSAWIDALAGDYDPAVLTAVWEADRSAPDWPGPPVWLHGDLHAGNLLLRDGTLGAVLDWSCLAVGDPAADLIPAWLLLDAAQRDAFRSRLGADEDTWRRGRAWAFAMSLAALPYYRTTNPFLAGIARRAIDEVLAETGHADARR